jgi:hypothetical protein
MSCRLNREAKRSAPYDSHAILLLPYLSFTLLYHDDARIHGIMDDEL